MLDLGHPFAMLEMMDQGSSIDRTWKVELRIITDWTWEVKFGPSTCYTIDGPIIDCMKLGLGHLLAAPEKLDLNYLIVVDEKLNLGTLWAVHERLSWGHLLAVHHELDLGLLVVRHEQMDLGYIQKLCLDWNLSCLRWWIRDHLLIEHEKLD